MAIEEPRNEPDRDEAADDRSSSVSGNGNSISREQAEWIQERMQRWHEDDQAQAAGLTEADTDEKIEMLADSDEMHEVEAETAPQDSKGIEALITQEGGMTDADQSPDVGAVPATANTPWTLQQFFDGQIDLDVELGKRFPSMPMMATIKFRTLGDKPNRRVATLHSQDGSASLIIDADTRTKIIQMSFSFGSMLTLRFVFGNLNTNQRQRWLKMMQRDQGGLSFLWGPERWQNDYLVCISRKYFTNLYAFSPHNFEAGVRLTPGVMEALLGWLKEVWMADDYEDDEPPPLLTW